MAIDPRKIGQIIARLRKTKGMTQRQLADRLGITQNYVGLFERGERNLSSDTLDRLGNLLKVPPELLVFLTTNAKPYRKENPKLADLIDETQAAILETIGLDMELSELT